MQKNNIDLAFCETDSPKLSESLSNSTEQVRMAKLPDILNALISDQFGTEWFEILHWVPANQIIVGLKNEIPAKIRGEKLLKLETLLKNIIDPAIEVFLEAKEDKNKLRKFRGVQIVNH